MIRVGVILESIFGKIFAFTYPGIYTQVFFGDKMKLFTVISKTFAAALAFSLCSAAHAEIENCYYDGDDFYVISGGNSYRQGVDDNFAGALVDCSYQLAAMYDGDDFYVFNDNTKSFDRQGVDDGFMDARINVTRNLAGMYDGDDFYVYSSSSKSFDRQGVDDLYTGSALVGTRYGFLFYDGDDLYANCGNGFDREGFVDDGLIGQASRHGISVGNDHFYLSQACKIQKN